MSGTAEGQCLGCKVQLPGTDTESEPEKLWCGPCKVRIPYPIRKAVCDPFDYEIRMKDGWMLRFAEAHIEGEFVRLVGAQDSGVEVGKDDEIIFEEEFVIRYPRGLYVRLVDIVWAADAPLGS